MDCSEAVESHPQGLIIRFEVIPGSSMLSVPSGFNPWRKVLEAKLTEEPSKGKANRQLVDAVAAIFDLPANQVEILCGHKSARKVVLVKGIAVERALLLLKMK
ncbi:MAG: DUF167 family protein [Methanotrichaceae archaeon]|nr:DUF167 family protein [Methanotrichaceae archaeon]